MKKSCTSISSLSKIVLHKSDTLKCFKTENRNARLALGRKSSVPLTRVGWAIHDLYTMHIMVSIIKLPPKATNSLD